MSRVRNVAGSPPRARTSRDAGRARAEPHGPAGVSFDAGLTAQCAAPPERARSDRLRRLGRPLRAVVGVAVAVLAWAAVTSGGLVDTTTFPTVPAFFEAAVDSRAELLDAVVVTLHTWALGLVGGAAVGVVLGTFVGRVWWADALSDLLVRVLRPLPSLALIPVAVLLLGLGTQMAASLVAYATFWPVFINTRYAVRQIEPQLLDTARSLGLGRAGLIRRVLLPAIAPGVATGVRIAMSIGIVVTVSVQLVSGGAGLGGFVRDAQANSLTVNVFVGAFVGGLLGWLLNIVFLKIVRVVIPWQPAAWGQS